MKKTLTALLLLVSVCVTQAQTKVFKEVGEDIQSTVKTIYQDNAVVGYVVFTQLEKASADSFNYKITLLDENLNDIGVVKFRELKLSLYGVIFEQDVLCLAYFKSNFYGNKYTSKREYKQAKENEKTSVLTQFLSLDGKIIKSNSLDVQVNADFGGKVGSKSYMGGSSLKSVHLRNIPGKGFVILYGDEHKNTLVTFNPAGEQLWQKQVKTFEGARLANMLVAKQYIYVLTKNKANQRNGDMQLGGYEVLGYHVADSGAPFKYTLKDKQGNSLSVNTFTNDAVTGNLFISGGVLDPGKGNTYQTAKHFARGTFRGLYQLQINGSKKSDVSEVYSYWNDESQPLFTRKGRNRETGTYCWYEGSIKDYQGNVYFYGTSFKKKVKVGSIISSALLAPTIFGIAIASFGYNKVKIDNTIFIKQDAKGALSIDKLIEGDKGPYFQNKLGWIFDTRSYMVTANPEAKNIHIIISDRTNYFLYNVNTRKIIRTFPRRTANTYKAIYPAKEGHIMVNEYNRTDRSTTVSIEAL